ncbi:MAG TPA: hypothetical protein VGB04_00995 [Allosphingosinicella sp.]
MLIRRRNNAGSPGAEAVDFGTILLYISNNYFSDIISMGKYQPLATHLQSASAGEWSATFAQVEQVLGFPLPPSARKHREWWSNQAGTGHSQARGWQDAGWRVRKVDLDGERVVFQRPGSNRLREEAQPFEGKEDLFDLAASYLGTRDRETIIQAALKALVEREAAKRLAALGGTMPDFKAPPRRRWPTA